MSGFFLFMDESLSPKIPGVGSIYSLTGVLIRLSQYAKLRADYYKLMEPWIRDGDKINLSPPMIHGSKLLPDETDESRVRVVQEICSLISKYCLPIYRSGYFDDELFRRTQMSPLSLCFGNLLNFLSDVTAASMVWPIMELGDTRQQRWFSETVKSLDILRQAGLDSGISIANSHNIGEVLYATKQHSVLANLADVVAYLRQIKDQNDHKPIIGGFKGDLLALSKSLEPMVREDVVTRMKYVK